MSKKMDAPHYKNIDITRRMPICNAIKNDLHQCSHRAVQDGEKCRAHIRIHNRHVERDGEHQAGRCGMFLSTGRWCPHEATPGELICQQHVNQREQRDIHAESKMLMRTMLTTALARDPQPTWQQFMDEVYANTVLTHHLKHTLSRKFFIRVTPNDLEITVHTNRVIWVVNGREGPDPTLRVPATQLARIVADPQNVHTAVVSTQTNTATEKLLSTPIPPTQLTERQMSVAWLTMERPPNFQVYLRVITDVHKWFLHNTCRTENDNLYRRLLRGLVALIERQEGEEKGELYKRLLEECTESVGLCCEGHISRLCNVMVGFDDAFQPPVSLGELMQSKMSAIAGMDLPVDERLRQAIAWFDEHGVVQSERTSWLSAIATM